MAVSVNGGPFCRFPYKESLTIWGRYLGHLMLWKLPYSSKITYVPRNQSRQTHQASGCSQPDVSRTPVLPVPVRPATDLVLRLQRGCSGATLRHSRRIGTHGLLLLAGPPKARWPDSHASTSWGVPLAAASHAAVGFRSNVLVLLCGNSAGVSKSARRGLVRRASTAEGEGNNMWHI